jgi:hypothetical protein
LNRVLTRLPDAMERMCVAPRDQGVCPGAGDMSALQVHYDFTLKTNDPCMWVSATSLVSQQGAGGTHTTCRLCSGWWIGPCLECGCAGVIAGHGEHVGRTCTAQRGEVLGSVVGFVQAKLYTSPMIRWE